MTKYAIISDLHLDHWVKYYMKTKEELLEKIYEKCMEQSPDFVIIAGDIWDGFMQSTYGLPENVVFVPGNHDYWYCPWPTKPFVNVRDNITSTSLWTNFRGWYSDIDNRYMCDRIFQGINDSRLIMDVSADKLVEHAVFSRDHIKNNPTDIVVTHFPAFLESVAPQYAGDAYNAYFVNDMEEDFKGLPIKLWVCGHVHHKHEYYIGDIRVICNPLAYPFEVYSDINDYQPVIVEI